MDNENDYINLAREIAHPSKSMGIAKNMEKKRKSEKVEDRLMRYLSTFSVLSTEEKRQRLIGMLEVARALRETKLVKIIRETMEGYEIYIPIN